MSLSSVRDAPPTGIRVDPAPARPLRIALFSPAWPGGVIPNGIVTYTAQLAPALQAKGVEVFIVAGFDESTPRDPRVSVPVRAPETLLERAYVRSLELFSSGAGAQRRNERAILAEIQRLERDCAIDLVEMEESFGWCGFVAERSKIPVVARLHGPWFLNGAMTEDTRTRVFKRRVRCEGRAIARVAGVSAPSRDVLERTRACYGHALADADVIPNPIAPVAEAELWDPAKCEPDTILFVGRFDRHKAGDVAIASFARVLAERPSARLLFAGPDPGIAGADGRRIQIREFIAEALPREADRASVEWLGQQPGALVRKLRGRAAVTIVCSRWENFPYTLAEAMSHGCPVVATATGGLVELVRDGENGLLAKPDDPDDLARAVLELLRDPARAARLGRRAAQSSALELGPAAVADRTLLFYRRVLARGR